MKTSLLTSLSIFALLLVVAPALAEIKTKTIAYKHGDLELEGYLAWDDAAKEKRPGVMIVHEWWGLNDYARGRAEQLAKLGYVAFCADMYGKGKVTEHAKEAQAWATQVRANADNWRARAATGLEVFRKQEQVDGSKIAAMGYCFGGSTVLTLAYTGADLKAVATFHGALPVPDAEQAKAIKARVLVCHGAVDSFIPEEVCLKFRKALDAAGTDYEFLYLSNAQHSFTVPTADAKKIDGMKYNKAADGRSFDALKDLLSETLK